MTASLDDLRQLGQQALAAVAVAADVAGLEQCRVHYLGRDGVLSAHLRQLSSLPPDIRPAYGMELNTIKRNFQQAITAKGTELKQQRLQNRLAEESLDVTLPGLGNRPGGRHPVMSTRNRIVDILAGMGFTYASGPDVEDEYHNFTALNIPANHPARTMHDTFYLNDGRLLRTHTSPVQIRYLSEHAPPLRMISAGRVYRRDQDMTHSPMFHQVEGLLIDEQVNFANLKNLLLEFMGAFFEQPARLRFRPSYFPFTEPSAEVDLWYGDGWLEVLGCGMVHPNVLAACQVDSERYSGFAFGMGVERLAMLRHQVDDLRLFYENDLRFLQQFS